jgi:hypothetical protein
MQRLILTRDVFDAGSLGENGATASHQVVGHIHNGLLTRAEGMSGRDTSSTRAHGFQGDGSDMTEPEKEDPQGRANELENIVDDLDEKVAAEREAEGVPGRPSDREDAATRGSTNEPPD